MKKIPFFHENPSRVLHFMFIERKYVFLAFNNAIILWSDQSGLIVILISFIIYTMFGDKTFLVLNFSEAVLTIKWLQS